MMQTQQIQDRAQQQLAPTGQPTSFMVNTTMAPIRTDSDPALIKPPHAHEGDSNSKMTHVTNEALDVKRLMAYRSSQTNTRVSSQPEQDLNGFSSTSTGSIADNVQPKLQPGATPPYTLASSDGFAAGRRSHGHAQDRTRNVQWMSLLPASLASTIPSPLASPISATAASLAAMSMVSPTSLTGFSGHDLQRVTVPRERKKSRPYSLSSADALFSQDIHQDGIHKDSSAKQLAPTTFSQQSQEHKNKAQSTPSTIDPTAGASLEKAPVSKSASQLRVNLYNLVSKGFLAPKTVVVFREHSAMVTERGTLIPQLKEPDAATLYPWLQPEYETPSAWATAMVKGGRTGKVAVNGWSAIKVPVDQDPNLAKLVSNQGMTEISLDVLRKRYLADMMSSSPDQADVCPAPMEPMKGSLPGDRKKRKRLPIRSGEASGLTITTCRTESHSAGHVKHAEQSRPRKRTVSGVDMDRQSYLEAAGTLYSLQDASMSPEQDMEGNTSYFGQPGKARPGYRSRLAVDRFGQPMPLQSLANYRREQDLARLESSRPPVPALKTVRRMLLRTMMSDVTLGGSCCVCCVLDKDRPFSPSGQTDQVKSILCGTCDETYHLDCIPLEARPSQALCEGPWQCPQCTLCNVCHRTIYEHPLAHHTASLEDGTTEPEEIQVLDCVSCRSLTHLRCQESAEPSIRDMFVVTKGDKDDLVEVPEWICLRCRECVECGFQCPQKGDGAGSNKIEPLGSQAMVDTESRDPETDGCEQEKEGGWSNGLALCPSCTFLAEKGNICPLCCRIYSDDDYETPMIFCDGCSLWVHVACDKGLQDHDYEELGQDSKQYFCPSCVPTPIPSPTFSASSSSSSSFYSATPSGSARHTPWESPCRPRGNTSDLYPSHSRATSSGTEEDWQQHHQHHHHHYQPQQQQQQRSGDSSRGKDDILDLIKAAKEISEAEARNYPLSHPHSYSRTPSPPPLLSSTSSSSFGAYRSSPSSGTSSHRHSRTVSVSLESVAEVAAAEALLTIFSGANTPVNSTPHASYPPSPFESTLTGFYDRSYTLDLDRG